MFKNSTEIFDFIKKNDVKLVDIRFIDLPGIQHHFNLPAEAFDEAVFTDGLMFDGSSIRGFQSIHESLQTYFQHQMLSLHNYQYVHCS